MVADGEFHPAEIFDRDALEPGHTIAGPAVIVEPTATTVIESGWTGEMTVRGHLVLDRTAPRPARVAVGTSVDPVMLEIFNNLFMSIAEQMGSVLENTAHSVNVKERLDFSCALFDPGRQPDRQRAAHAGASRARWAKVRARDHRGARRYSKTRRRIRAERALRRRHASA